MTARCVSVDCRHRPAGLERRLGETYMFYDTDIGDHGLPHNPFKSLVVPGLLAGSALWMRKVVPI